MRINRIVANSQQFRRKYCNLVPLSIGKYFASFDRIPFYRDIFEMGLWDRKDLAGEIKNSFVVN